MRTGQPALCLTEVRDRAFHRRVLNAIARSGIPVLAGGGYAIACYTDIGRDPKDLDLFVRRRDCQRTLRVLSMVGCRTEVTYPHWLAKAFLGRQCIDLIFGSGNGIAEVDDGWFAHAVPGEILGHRMWLCPPEEMIWAKAFVMERERYDGADIAHIILARGERLDWPRLLARFAPHWRVLLSHLVLFGFIYPGRRSCIPAWVLLNLLGRLEREVQTPSAAAEPTVCQGTLLSRAQYLVDVGRWGYRDARRPPTGSLSPADIAKWTAGIEAEREIHADR